MTSLLKKIVVSWNDAYVNNGIHNRIKQLFMHDKVESADPI